MRALFFLLLVTSYLLTPQPVSAHAFGTLYTLPIPLWLYLFGAGAALIISFLLIGLFANESTHVTIPKLNIKLNPSIIFLFKVISISLFILTILTGFFGTQSPVQNFAVNFFWIIFMLGFTYLTALLSDIWEIVNPWKIMLSMFKELKPIISYPKSLGYFPALFFYFILIWLELLSQGFATRPQNLSLILLSYTTITILGAILFGKEAWFKYGDFFSVFFKLIGNRSLSITPHFSLLLFILFMLSSTAFDGFRGTYLYFRYFFSFNPIVLLAASFILFLSLYLIAIFLMKLITKSNFSIKALSLQFAFSLIPIALAYNVAHYYTLLITQGQQIIPLFSDPFNKGLNLFATADYQINIGILNAGFIWNSEVVVIILGHIMAVVISHLIALKVFPKNQAMISQIPMLILMVIYTITGLWILSQPITSGL